MKRLIYIFAFILLSPNSFSQEIVWGARVSGLINTTLLGSLKDIETLKNYGVNLGVSAKIKFEVERCFVNPELYCRQVSSGGIGLPILAGYEITKNVSLLVGSTLTYPFYGDLKNDFSHIVNRMPNRDLSLLDLSSKFTAGHQGGVQTEVINNFLISAMYCGSFDGQVVTIQNQVTGLKEKEEIKISYISLGLGYNF